MELEIKSRLISLIQQTSNLDVLNRVEELLKKSSSDSVYELSEEQLSAVRESQQQIKNGEYYEHDDVIKELEEWLAKK